MLPTFSHVLAMRWYKGKTKITKITVKNEVAIYQVVVEILPYGSGQHQKRTQVVKPLWSFFWGFCNVFNSTALCSEVILWAHWMHMWLTSLSNTITPTSFTPLPVTLCLPSPPYWELLVRMEASFFSQRPSLPRRSSRICLLFGGGGGSGVGHWRTVKVTCQDHLSRRS